MLDSAIRIVRVVDGSRTGDSGNFERVTIYHYRVADKGPFVDLFAVAENTPAKVAERLNARARELRELGAIPQAEV